MLLSIEQRLNLVALLGNLECRNISDTRGVWRLMDSLELTEEDKAAVELVAHQVNGGQTVTWKNEKAPPAKEFDLTDSQLALVERALATSTQWIPGATRRWLEPLLDQMPERNGELKDGSETRSAQK